MPKTCLRKSLLVLATLIPLAGAGIEVRAQADIDDILGAHGKELSLEEIFALMDKDNSGTVTRDELRTHKMGVFFNLDRNGDGVLTRDEVPRLTDEEFQAIDADGDGKISGFEFNQSKETEFETLDLNGDGVITLDEFVKGRDASAK
ncbi:MAG: EF-hand domain-containing protein [Kiloniellales bacterium]|nr:EF-hand domain-containing protein [Kiloniellales bacterium]